MAIYNIFDYSETSLEEKATCSDPHMINPETFVTSQINEHYIPKSDSQSSHLFSALAARFFFFLLLIADLVWGVYSLTFFAIKSLFCLLTLGSLPALKKSCGRSWLNLKRSIVCGIALFVAIFSPALGIMFSCMYFLMYDKNGVEEVVPASLRDQFKEIFPI